MMCKSKHFFRDTEYFIYEKENSIQIGKNEQQIKYKIQLELTTIITWVYGDRNQFIGFKFKWKQKMKTMVVNYQNCLRLKSIFDGKVSYSNLVKMFNKVKQIRQHSQNTIILVHSCIDQRPYQMKVTPNSINYNMLVSIQIITKDFMIELEVLNLKHKNMIAISEYFVENDKFYIIFEYLEGRSLRERMNSQYKMKKEEVIVVLKVIILSKLPKQLLSLLIALHRRGFICRDLSQDNIFIQKDGRIVVTEFGQITKLGEILRTKRGTKDIDLLNEYMFPNNLEGNQNNEEFDRQFWFAQDVYCLGELLHEMLTGKSLQKTIFDKYTIFQSSQNTMSTLRRKFGLRKLLDRMLEPDPKLRISAQQAQNFIKDMEFGDDSFVDFSDQEERNNFQEVYQFISKVCLQNL
ncbi:unnamed protein product (macronuclear) [Paramecium tetraurelia]|uniref:non-specific serine/threonine protein kinase n=1 Tax=Paramecium tetraurelia TaxID=5888 RepID=A0E861_PARTE|nr:uncharacterized protein GSPATT00024206001 [Paramecium tetraurelia]CAK91478.1 unnamed protein product [Paramecium tetraurelia]|eukprot:XP_001458875.1 hypothetical protein (macronuclear) [Paramecium tetraurelia strain d4-2]